MSSLSFLTFPYIVELVIGYLNSYILLYLINKGKINIKNSFSEVDILNRKFLKIKKNNKVFTAYYFVENDTYNISTEYMKILHYLKKKDKVPCYIHNKKKIHNILRDQQVCINKHIHIVIKTSINDKNVIISSMEIFTHTKLYNIDDFLNKIHANISH
jgi:hypothetical protein